MLLKILAVGDVVGEGGQDILARRLRELREDTGAHFAVVNGENASGVGITPAQARRREWALKQLSRAEKLALVADGGPSTKGGDWS